MSKPRIAVIGCGQWGQNHVRTLHELGALAAIADGNAERANEIAGRFAVPALGVEAIFADREIQAVVLALPAQLHGEMARAAFAAGKDVLIEKPIGLNVADARLTAKAAADRGRLVMVGHVLRFHPVFQRLEAFVAEGGLGTVRHIISTRLGLGRFLGMDVVWDLAPHDLSLVLKIAGNAPDDIQTLSRSILSPEIDTADIRMNFPDGISAEVHVSRVSPFRDRRFSVVGTEGMITFDDLAPEGQKLAFYGHRVWREGTGLAMRNADPEFLETEPGLPLDRELRHFIDCIDTRRDPETGAAEAVQTVRILAEASPLDSRQSAVPA